MGLTVTGVTGEVFILRHELIECYPFKMMTYPPAAFYEHLGNAGAFVIAAILVTVGVWWARTWPMTAPPGLALLGPLLYLAAVAALTVVCFGASVPSGMRNLDGYTIRQATADFGRVAAGLSIAGIMIGGVGSGLVLLVGKWWRGDAAV